MEKRKKLHYAWIVFIGCILVKFGIGGSVMMIAGNFVTPVVQEMGCSVSQFTMVVSVEAGAMALMYTTASKVLMKKKIGVVMGIAALAQVVGIALMGIYQTVEMFWLSGAIIGVGVAFTGYVAIPLVVNMWFHKKAGTVLGIIVAAEYVAMISYNLLSAKWIVDFGWRTAYFIMAACALVFSLPIFFCIKRPEDMNCKPYGYEESTGAAKETTAEWGLMRKEAVRKPVFYIVWLTCICYSIGCGVQQYIATFVTMELGQTIAFGAMAAMCLSLGCVVGSMVLGWINDKFGVKAGLTYGMVCMLVGYVVMTLSIGNPVLSIPASFIVGLGGTMYTVQCPLIARSVLGGKDYSSIWSLMMMGNSMVGAFTFSSIGLFYDKGGTYKGAFFMAIGLHIVALAIGAVAINKGKKYRMETV